MRDRVARALGAVRIAKILDFSVVIYSLSRTLHKQKKCFTWVPFIGPPIGG